MTGLLAATCSGWATELLPESPTDGLQVTMTLSCDFDDDFWDVALLYGTAGPLNLSYRDRNRRERRRNLIVTVDERLEIYARVRQLLTGFQLGEWSETEQASQRGELTFTVSVLLIKPGVGRVDSVDLAIDLTEGRPIPTTVRRLLDTLSEIDRRMRMNLTCP
ncbi:MAG: hypothetical protein V3U43_09250 [Pseudomonadales bacterium]